MGRLGPANPARVKASGRVGDVIQHDPEDKDLSYKLSFDDGQTPACDWFGREEVELMTSAEALPQTGSTAGTVPVLPQWAASRPAGTPVADEHFICMGSKAPICPPPKTWAEDATARPAGTPVADEHFICMGSKAPKCPAPTAPKNSGPITLEVLQGEWLGSGGAAIAVTGTDVYMNGMLLNQHKVQLRDDGTVASIGKIWQLDRWAPEGNGIEFRASSTREGMESARLEVWSRKAAAAPAWSEKMKLMGYAGSSADPLGRGVEGCQPGTSGAEMPIGYNQAKDKEEVGLLGALINQWREPGTHWILPAKVVPDATNRAQTGLGVELVHFVAQSMEERGFQKRKGRHGHDIPVVVREPSASATHAEAIALWRQRVSEEEGFPPVRAKDDEEIFTSLGNGHFFQALNLFGCRREAINRPGHHYDPAGDQALSQALESGVPGIVLRHEAPRPVRAKIAALLNSKREFFWTLNEDGSVNTEDSMEENTNYCSQFEWLSKGMDAVQVDCLVRTHLGIRESKRIQG